MISPTIGLATKHGDYNNTNHTMLHLSHIKKKITLESENGFPCMKSSLLPFNAFKSSLLDIAIFSNDGRMDGLKVLWIGITKQMMN